MKKKTIIKTIQIKFLVGLAVGGVLVFSYFAILENAVGLFDKTYSTTDLINNFNDKRQEIYETKRYFNSIVPKYKNVDIEFEDDKIARLVISPIDTGRGSDLTVNFQDWNIPIKSKKTDSLLAVLGWNTVTLRTLKTKLDNANCISIANGEPTTIGFQRSGMGMYSFDVFNKPIPDSLKARYNDSCMFIYVNKTLVLEYGGGAFGSQCFAKEK
ncbi:hypothetical protein EWM62_18200 [Mucilaginibacter terrigena]|uniref:Uncharacterized protein n=1 Tax=Mucilaginibacter terrigena TaxID=2492395 RepID=A0A4V1ZBF0_9SPHI|nr:hypothetical protein [Mucilaginibacter terrigena]RYU86586.1 hypothetical protein EWM62_18200 [Mucilaginibacter terrigena]